VSLPLKIVVLRYRFIGDTLLSVPFFRNLRNAYPTAIIDAVLAPDSAELLQHCPYINSTLLLRKGHFWETVAQLRRNGYHKAYVLKRSLSSASLAFLAGIGQRVGFVGQGCDTGRGLLLTHQVPYRAGNGQHECEALLSVLQAEQHPVDDGHLESWWHANDALMATEHLAPFSQCYNMGLNLTSSNPLKQWPVADATRWPVVIEQLCQQVQATHGQTLALHCLGSVADSLVVEAMRQQLPEALRSQLINHCGQTTLNEGMAMLSHMRGMLGVDSGLLHMAAAVGIPVVSLFGPMDETQWAPLVSPQAREKSAVIVAKQLPCRPCNLKTPCGHQYACLTNLSAQAVMACF
jgi:heptosyltransferase II